VKKIGEATEALEKLDDEKKELEDAAQVSMGNKIKLVISEAVKTGCTIVPEVSGMNIKFTMSGQAPGDIATIVESINTLIQSAIEVVKKTPEIIKQLIELGKTASEFPPKIKTIATSSGLSPLAIPKAIKNLTLNIKYLAGAPDDVKEFLESIKKLLEEIKEIAGVSSDKNEEGQKEVEQESNQSKQEEKESNQSKQEEKESNQSSGSSKNNKNNSSSNDVVNLSMIPNSPKASSESSKKNHYQEAK